MPITGTSQFLDSATSVALTLPTAAQITTTFGGIAQSRAGIEIVAIIIAQGQIQWYRTDGSAATAADTGGISLAVGDWLQVEGRAALSAFRVIRGAGGGALKVSYYLYRAAPGARF